MRLVPASQRRIAELGPFITQVLKAIGEATGEPRVVLAFITDESSVNDFLDTREKPMRIRRRNSTNEWRDLPADPAAVTRNERALKRLAALLGVAVARTD